MTLPRNFEKELEDAFVAFRAKCSELNLVNAEFAAIEDVRKKAAEAINAEREKYNDFLEREVQPIGARLTEVRSELQAMQAHMLDLVIEFMIRGKNG